MSLHRAAYPLMTVPRSMPQLDYPTKPRDCLFDIEHSDTWESADRSSACEKSRYVGYRTDATLVETVPSGSRRSAGALRRRHCRSLERSPNRNGMEPDQLYG